MKLNYQWLQSFFREALPRDQLAKTLTNLGLEVESSTELSGAWTDVVVAHVQTVEKHPNADQLSICRVLPSEGSEALQVVCGAKNVYSGMKTPLAMVGARLPGNFKIKRSKIRGEYSEGMLCSEAELGLAESASGIMALPADAPVGTPLAIYLQSDDVVWDLAITPNRSDCLSVRGVAREIALKHPCGLLEKAIGFPEACLASNQSERPKVRLVAKSGCVAYTAIRVDGISAKQASPIWLKEWLRRCGLRSIHPVVDVCNAMMLAYGQPMHAFDADRLSASLTVRYAKAGEQMRALDGEVLSLSAEDLVIADEDQVLALAGVMGGAYAEVGSETTAVILESACFDALTVRKAAQRHRLHTESSHRFERGVDPTIQAEVLQDAAAFVIALVGGQTTPALVLGEPPAACAPIRLSMAHLKRVLGLDLTAEAVAHDLRHLGMKATVGDQHVDVTPPPARLDINDAVDLIEEVIRLRGFDELDSAPMAMQGVTLPHLESLENERRLLQTMVALGYQESIHFAIASSALQSLFVSEGCKPITLSNPLSESHSTMRVSLLPGLLQSVAHNLRRQHARVQLFEIGRCFYQGQPERQCIAGVLTGPRFEPHWDMPKASADFYDIKQHVLSLFALLGCEGRCFAKASEHPAWHPYQSQRLYLGDKPVGWMGSLSSSLLQSMKINHKIIAFELELDGLHRYFSNAATKMPSPPTTPMIRRDIALKVPKKWTYQEVYEKIEEFGKKQLKKCELFDIYEGEAIGDLCVSMAFRLTFQAADRTLRDEEVDAWVASIVKGLADGLNVQLRDE